MNTYVPLGFDLMAKKVFGNQDDIKPIKILLKRILGMNVKKVIVLNNELIDRPYVDKKNMVDLLVELDDNALVGIEINSEVSESLFDRNLFYMARVMSRDLSPSEDYSNFKKHIQINFDFEGYHESPIITYMVCDIKNGNNVFSDKMKLLKIDVPYFYKLWYNIDNRKLTKLALEYHYNDINEVKKLIRLIALFYERNGDNAKKIVKGDKDMEDIYSRIEDYSEKFIGVYDKDCHDRETRKAYMKEKTEEAIKEGLEKGMQQGLEQGISLMVMNMLNKNLSLEMISEISGLSIDKIKNIKNSENI